ncbi:hypothetical protein VARIO8X_90186 [Burkholderiales bacterium 8X]|nr:hypothetical protein VARIO8X_90186 [Burkholderiales bacterium 8X]
MKAILSQALGQPSAERAAFLDRACGTDGALRLRVESMLQRADIVPEDFLETPPPEVSAPVHVEPEWRGRTLGDYQILRRIGLGGMGQVYLAERSRGPRSDRIAIKALRHDVDTPTLRLRFEQEGRLQARLRHEGVTRWLGQDAIDGAPCLLMEHVDGLAIDRHCRRFELGLRSRIELVAKLAGAVQHAHDHGIVHGDIKASNVLVAPSGMPKLLDFGIAQEVHGKPNPAQGPAASALLFTPECAAPEQLEGREPTLRTDVYALGLLLYRLLTPSGSQTRSTASGLPKPSWPSSGAELCLASEYAARYPPDLLSGLPPGERLASLLRGAIDAALQRALSCDPAARQDSPDSLSLELRRCIGRLPAWV